MSFPNTLVDSKILWEPTGELISQSNLQRFSDQVGIDLFPYERLHRWSISNLNGFWSHVWGFANIIGDKGERGFVPAPDGGMLGAQWFPDAQLNYAENLLNGEADSVAVVAAKENGDITSFTWQDLREQVAKAQEGLRRLGVEKGDRVAGVLTNDIEALVALLATTAIGATWTSCSPDFGAQGIIDRIGQVKPKVLIASLDYQYNQKYFDIRENIRSVSKFIEGLSTIVILTNDRVFANSISNQEVISWDNLTNNDKLVPTYTRVAFNHPLFILYTSGTTGLPKAIVHSVGGTLLQHVKEHQLHCDVKQRDVMFWYTNTAWMMYPWLVSGLASGATILLYDGSPLLQGKTGLLWEVAERAGVTHFGTSPKYLEALMKANYSVGREHDVSKLRCLLSCGAPLLAEQFDWVYNELKRDVILASISGGTEIIGCFVMGSPVHPVRRGEITCKALGMAVDVLDRRGASVVGEKGELVCTKPFPSMPITFWGFGGKERYHSAYFSEREGIWTHGDFAEQTIEQSLIIYGRTDTTLNPGGVRIGTAEIYRVIEQIPQVRDSLVFGIPVNHDEEIVLCVVTQSGLVEQELAELIRSNIRKSASPRHVPRRIYCVTEVPYTNNGKKVEGAARLKVVGQPVKNTASLANPQCLEEYASLLERSFV